VDTEQRHWIALMAAIPSRAISVSDVGMGILGWTISFYRDGIISSMDSR
jgi:hypothetical protein